VGLAVACGDGFDDAFFSPAVIRGMDEATSEESDEGPDVPVEDGTSMFF
jgi:hypothetical protein